jgi:hypothetical protein
VSIGLFTCPCCGYPGLELPPYSRLTELSRVRDLAPPYEEWLGDPSYDVCPCCGFEFGNDDNPGTSAPVSFGEYLREWTRGGCQWFDPHEETRELAARAATRPSRNHDLKGICNARSGRIEKELERSHEWRGGTDPTDIRCDRAASILWVTAVSAGP